MVLDIVLGFIFVFFVIRGAQKGVSTSLIRLLCTATEIVAALFLTSPLAEYLETTALCQRLTENFEEILVSNHITITDVLPESLSSIFGFIENDFTASYLVNAALYVISFLLIMIVISLVAGILEKMFASRREKRTVSGVIDMMLGGLLGAVKGAILVYVFLACLFPVAGVISPDSVETLVECLDSSYFAGFLYDNNPLVFILKNIYL